MTIGPAPMIRIEEMSVRLGMPVSRAQGRACDWRRPFRP